MLKCGWLNIRELAVYHTLLQFFKTVQWGSPAPMRLRIDIDEDNLISTERPRLLLTKGSYRAKSASLWNNLPGYLRSETSVSRFKVLLKRWIIERRDLDMETEEDQDMYPDQITDPDLDPDPDPVQLIPATTPDPGPDATNPPPSNWTIKGKQDGRKFR